MAWLKMITAVDLGIHFAEDLHFAMTQEMTEEFNQEVEYRGAFGSDGPVARRVRKSDEGTISGSVILLKEGQRDRMNDEDNLMNMRDFTVTCQRGQKVRAYNGCNWRRISIRSTLDQVTLDFDITAPGYPDPIG